MIWYKNLFLIDDDEDDHEFFMDAIKEIDTSIKCSFSFDGEKALGQLQQLKRSELPDLIILDTNLPKLTGKQILIELKRDPVLKAIPVVMYSTFFAAGDNEQLMKLGAVHYLAKPSKFDEFKAALMKILQTKW